MKKKLTECLPHAVTVVLTGQVLVGRAVPGEVEGGEAAGQAGRVL